MPDGNGADAEPAPIPDVVLGSALDWFGTEDEVSGGLADVGVVVTEVVVARTAVRAPGGSARSVTRVTADVRRLTVLTLELVVAELAELGGVFDTDVDPDPDPDPVPDGAGDGSTGHSGLKCLRSRVTIRRAPCWLLAVMPDSTCERYVGLRSASLMSVFS